MHEVYSLSAIDLFASAMGAFIIISIILMPDYQKEVRLEGHLAALEALAQRSDARVESNELGIERLVVALSAARTRQQELEAEAALLESELQTREAQLVAAEREPPPPPPEYRRPVWALRPDCSHLYMAAPRRGRPTQVSAAHR